MGNNLKRKLRRPTTDHSDADSNIWSFQEPSSVQDLSKHSGKRMMGVFREARVVLKRLTSQQLREAGNKSTRQVGRRQTFCLIFFSSHIFFICNYKNSMWLKFWHGKVWTRLKISLLPLVISY